MTAAERLPRLYVPADLGAGAAITLADGQAHYLRTVMRRKTGDEIRLFNGRDGEWRAVLELSDKKSTNARPAECLRTQPVAPAETHLLFAPLKKDALDFLVEKAVELGATHLHPVLTQNTEVRRINDERLRQQMIEAAEQCERLSVPVQATVTPLNNKLATWNAAIPLYAALERMEAGLLKPAAGDAAFLIGPEGGFTADEKQETMAYAFVRPVSLGETILRAETAALFCLAARRLAG